MRTIKSKLETAAGCNRHILFVVIFFILLSSCESFTDTAPPASQLFGRDVFEDKTTATAAMSGIYVKLRDTGMLSGLLGGLNCRLGLYADEFEYYQTGTPDNFYTNSLIAGEGRISDLWNQSYNQIYMANAVIEGVEQSNSLLQADRDQLRGEALFVRALVHFYLVNLFGNIPYVETTDYQQNTRISRLSIQEVCGHIKADLNAAAALLPDAYIAPERIRPNRGAVYALLARTCLYEGSWAEASDAASAVINNPEYVWENDLDKVFLKDSPATIWQFSSADSGSNTAEAQIFIFNSGPPLFVSLSNDMINSFEAGDQRKEHWVRAVSNGNQTWYHAYKYKHNLSTPSSMEYSIVFRLSEQYLIRAEARARQGDIIGAQQDLNRVRSGAGLPPTPAATSESLVEAVLIERRSEFFTEYGHRFLDLKRYGKLDTVLPLTKPGWNTADRLWPIPAQELLSNPNLYPQNEGY